MHVGDFIYFDPLIKDILACYVFLNSLIYFLIHSLFMICLLLQVSMRYYPKLLRIYFNEFSFRFI